MKEDKEAIKNLNDEIKKVKSLESHIVTSLCLDDYISIIKEVIIKKSIHKEISEYLNYSNTDKINYIKKIKEADKNDSSLNCKFIVDELITSTNKLKQYLKKIIKSYEFLFKKSKENCEEEEHQDLENKDMLFNDILEFEINYVTLKDNFIKVVSENVNFTDDEIDDINNFKDEKRKMIINLSNQSFYEKEYKYYETLYNHLLLKYNNAIIEATKDINKTKRKILATIDNIDEFNIELDSNINEMSKMGSKIKLNLKIKSMEMEVVEKQHSLDIYYLNTLRKKYLEVMRNKYKDLSVFLKFKIKNFKNFKIEGNSFNIELIKKGIRYHKDFDVFKKF